MGYKKKAAKKNKEKKKERPKVVRAHTGIKYDGIRTDMKPTRPVSGMGLEPITFRLEGGRSIHLNGLDRIQRL
jgi:hypothetical protein